MISAKTALNAVRNRATLNYTKELDPELQKVSDKVIRNINNGWLCANLQTDKHASLFKSLGYQFEDGILYWLY